jgi:hypothetical protein
MAFLRFDEQHMTLDIVVGVNENYLPNDKNDAFFKRIQVLRAKMSEWNKKEEEFLKTEITPELTALRTEITTLNETVYPSLKTVREQRELEGNIKR